MRRHIDLPGLRWHRITAQPADPGLAPFRLCHDLFGDGSLVLLPAPGHTPSSMSLLVRRPGLPPLMMGGDVTYDADLLELGHVPGVGSRRRLRQATAMINTMRQLPGNGNKDCGIQVRAPATKPRQEVARRMPVATARYRQSRGS